MPSHAPLMPKTEPLDREPKVPGPWSIRPRAGMTLLLLLVPALVFLDYRASGFSLQLFYLMPTALAAWVFGRKTGIAIAAVAAAFCMMVAINVRPTATIPEHLWEAATNFIVFGLFAIIIARQRKFYDESLDRARIDEETGLVSRREFERLLDAETKRSQRYRRPLATVVVECAIAKGRKGTAQLAAIGRAMQTQLRDGDAVARVADRRLGVILLECPPGSAMQVVGRVRGQLLEAIGARLQESTLAFGLVCYAGTKPASAGEIMQLADAQVGASRREGKAGVAETSIV